MLQSNSNWSINDSKQCEREDMKRFFSNMDFSRAKLRRSDNSLIAGMLEISFENGRIKTFIVERQKETANQGSWKNSYLGDFYTLKALKAAAIEDVDTYAY